MKQQPQGKGLQHTQVGSFRKCGVSCTHTARPWAAPWVLGSVASEAVQRLPGSELPGQWAKYLQKCVWGTGFRGIINLRGCSKHPATLVAVLSLQNMENFFQLSPDYKIGNVT